MLTSEDKMKMMTAVSKPSLLSLLALLVCLLWQFMLLFSFNILMPLALKYTFTLFLRSCRISGKLTATNVNLINFLQGTIWDDSL